MMKICPEHQDYPVPLIWTFAFAYTEWWCPYCGYKTEMFGQFDTVENTSELEERLKKYKLLASSYLKSFGIYYKGPKVEWVYRKADV